MPGTGFVQVVTTVGSREAADALARSAVEARVAACAQVLGPVTSTYWWEGAVQSSQEWMVTFKTAVYATLEEHIKRLHDYDVPEIIATPIDADRRRPSRLPRLDRS